MLYGVRNAPVDNEVEELPSHGGLHDYIHEAAVLIHLRKVSGFGILRAESPNPKQQQGSFPP